MWGKYGMENNNLRENTYAVYEIFHEKIVIEDMKRRTLEEHQTMAVVFASSFCKMGFKEGCGVVF